MEYENFTTEIKKTYNKYYSRLKDNFGKLDKDPDFKYIAVFGMLLMEYGKDMCCLIENGRYSSIVPLNRDFVECYRHTFHLLVNFADKNVFSEYVKYLYAADLFQDKGVFESLKADSTAGDDKEKELQNIIKGAEKTLRAYFPEWLPTEYNDTVIWNTVEKIWKKYSPYDNKTKEVGKAIAQNAAFSAAFGKPFDGSNTVYRTMCRSAHNNISSLLSRMIVQRDDKSYIRPNSPDRNIEGALCLTYYCMKDICDKTFNLLESM